MSIKFFLNKNLFCTNFPKYTITFIYFETKKKLINPNFYQYEINHIKLQQAFFSSELLTALISCTLAVSCIGALGNSTVLGASSFFGSSFFTESYFFTGSSFFSSTFTTSTFFFFFLFFHFRLYIHNNS